MAGPRIILFLGKGGVGKTTAAAATALRAAQRGYRTVVLSTDAAHSLADSFNTPLGNEPTAIAPNLWGQETDVYYNLSRYWGVVQEWIKALMAWRGIDELVADEIAVLPSMEELSNLLWINHHHQEGEYDVIIVDCAPTAATLRLLSFPDAASWWVDRILPLHRRLMGLVRPVVRSFSDMPLPSEDVYAAGEDLIRRLAQLRSFLADTETSSVRLVLNLEKMVIKETQRTFTYLNLYGYATDAILCNRLLPQQVRDRFFEAWKESQDYYLEAVKEAFSPLPILGVPLLNQEVVGLPMLEQVAAALYGEGDPTAILYRGQSHEFTQEDGRYVLTIALPFASKEEISLVRTGDELIVRVGRERRNIILPRAFHGLSPVSARLRDDKLRITFAPQEP
ncbi:MAG: ArsA family ATPase [Dehalococcoidia bacterium]